MDDRLLKIDNTNEIFFWGTNINDSETYEACDGQKEIVSKKTFSLLHSFLADQVFYKHIVRYRIYFLVSRGLSNEDSEKQIRENPQYDKYSTNPLEIVKIFDIDPDYPDKFLLLCTTAELKLNCVLLLLRPEQLDANIMKYFSSSPNCISLYTDKTTLVKAFIQKKFLEEVERKFAVED